MAKFKKEEEEDAEDNEDEDTKKKETFFEPKKSKSLYSTNFKRCLKIMERTVV
jgi:hypothetical protein